jgi:16S rRNA (guanine(966)-N(2))-methyltransferase RsmD
MRIIGGEHRGRLLQPNMKGWPTRPTTDISKEGLFNILMNLIDFEEVSMLDLFGGTGNHSWEFLSRGCQDVTYVDKHRNCISFIKKTSSDLGYDNELKIVAQDVSKFIKQSFRSYDYIFAGPPYPLKWLDEIPDLVFNKGLLAPDGLFVLEHNPEHNFEKHPRFMQQRNYGQTIFCFFK